jgi:hypothetical protein
MKVLTGHITATERKVINAMIENGWETAQTKMLTCQLVFANGVYTFKTKKRDRGMIPCAGSELRTSIYTSTFTM